VKGKSSGTITPHPGNRACEDDFNFWLKYLSNIMSWVTFADSYSKDIGFKAMINAARTASREGKLPTFQQQYVDRDFANDTFIDRCAYLLNEQELSSFSGKHYVKHKFKTGPTMTAPKLDGSGKLEQVWLFQVPGTFRMYHERVRVTDTRVQNVLPTSSHVYPNQASDLQRSLQGRRHFGVWPDNITMSMLPTLTEWQTRTKEEEPRKSSDDVQEVPEDAVVAGAAAVAVKEEAWPSPSCAAALTPVPTRKRLLRKTPSDASQVTGIEGAAQGDVESTLGDFDDGLDVELVGGYININIKWVRLRKCLQCVLIRFHPYILQYASSQPLNVTIV